MTCPGKQSHAASHRCPIHWSSSSPAIERRGWFNEKQDSFAGFEPQYLQPFFVCHHSSFQPLRISPGVHSPAPLVFQVHLHVLQSQAVPVPVLGSKAGPYTLPEGVPGTETSLGLRAWRKSPANQAQRLCRAGFGLPSSARSNSTPLLQEEASACRPKPLQSPFKSRSCFKACTMDNTTVTGQPTNLRRSYWILHFH